MILNECSLKDTHVNNIENENELEEQSIKDNFVIKLLNVSSTWETVSEMNLT